MISVIRDPNRLTGIDEKKLAAKFIKMMITTLWLMGTSRMPSSFILARIWVSISKTGKFPFS